MALNYRSPRVRDEGILNPASLDSVFNNYFRAKQLAQAGQSNDLQAQLAQQQLAAGQRTAQDAEVTRAAQFGPRLGAEDQAQAITQAGSSFAGPVNPKYAEFVSGFNALRQKQSQPTRLAESEIDVNEAKAKALGEKQIYVDPDTGRQIVVPRGAKLIPRPPKGGKAATNQDLTSAMELYETAKEGLISGLGGSETGQLVGRLPAITAKQQIAKGSVAAMAPVLKQIFRTAGEGVFTDRDQELLLEMIPTRTELPEARTAMIANIDAIVKAKIKSGMRQTSPDGLSQPSASAAPINLTGAKAARLAELRAKAGR